MKDLLWVVYKKALKNYPPGMNAVCEQDEWDAMERAHPGEQPLVQDGIASEGEAERHARGASGDRYRLGASPRIMQRHPRPEPSVP